LPFDRLRALSECNESKRLKVLSPSKESFELLCPPPQRVANGSRQQSPEPIHGASRYFKVLNLHLLGLNLKFGNDDPERRRGPGTSTN